LPGGTEFDAQKLNSAAAVRAEKALSHRRGFQSRLAVFLLHEAEARIYSMRQTGRDD